LNLTVLGSGSEGNAVLVRSGDATILIDAGFSGKTITCRVEDVGVRTGEIQALVITHEHVDHVRGAGVLARRLKIPVYATEGTFHRGRSRLGALPRQYPIAGGSGFQIGSLTLHPFDISHDATEPVGFVIDDGTFRIGVCTDSGCVTHLMREKLRHCDALVLEMNHDPTMLLAGPYPWELKQRIRSRIGHLSNDDASEFIRDLWHPGLKHIFLAHLSKENNLPELARMAAEEALLAAGCSNGDTRIHVTTQHQTSELITL